MQIHHCIRTSKVTIIYHHLRMFLVECARSVAQTQQPMGDAEAARIAYAAEQHILLLIDDDEVLFQEPDSRNIIMDTRELNLE
jgi:predicted nucleic acid-binding protein